MDCGRIYFRQLVKVDLLEGKPRPRSEVQEGVSDAESQVSVS